VQSTFTGAVCKASQVHPPPRYTLWVTFQTQNGGCTHARDREYGPYLPLQPVTQGDGRRRARVVVVGAGFAGASLIRNLPLPLRRPGETLLIDREEEYAFVPLIHEVAVGRVHPESIVSPIPPLCERRCAFLRAEVTGANLAERVLETSSGPVGYEYLILAVGSGAAHPGGAMAPHLQLFWTLHDALWLRGALDEAWRSRAAGPGGLTVAIAGGGATGVELAAEVAVLFRYLKKRTYRRRAFEPRVVLFEAEDRLVGWLDRYFHDVALKELTRLGVEVRLSTAVVEASQDGIRAEDGWLPARIRVWAAGIDVPDLVRNLPGKHDATGRLAVDANLTLPGHPEVYVLGDAGLYRDARGELLPPTASVAVQQGPWAARDLGRRLRGSRRRPFRFLDRGYVVSLGPRSAVAEALGAKLQGAAAQALYRSVLLYYLGSRRDRILTGADWLMEPAMGRLGFEAAGKPRSG
jgi:NADH:ubiquinone reductase (H+-translocating)